MTTTTILSEAVSSPTATPSPETVALVRAGAKAARDGQSRSDNPHDLNGEKWSTWMDGFDHQTVWLEHGRGDYDPFADMATDAT